jgi:hypothetical protein
MFEKIASKIVGLSPIMCSASKLSSKRGFGGTAVELPPPPLELPFPKEGMK